MAIFIIFNYIVLKFLYTNELDNMMAYGSYVFEVLFVFFVMNVYKEKTHKPRLPNVSEWFFGAVSLMLGLGVYAFATASNIPIPFDLTSMEAVLFLLVIGPILEELLFRQALWFAFEELFKNKWLTLATTSILFSFAHFYAYFHYEGEVRRFIIYQTAYTLLLGVWWGLSYLRTHNIAQNINLHMTFNLGFYIGYLIS